MNNDDRAYFVDLLSRIASPVLGAMSQGRLRQAFRVEYSPAWGQREPAIAYLECFGRLMSGLSAWLSLGADDSDEGTQRETLTRQALASFAHSVDPKSPDYLLWAGDKQALVDAAYFCSAFLRAPRQLWAPLDATTKTRIVESVHGLRRYRPIRNNWLLFPAMLETFLLSIGERFHIAPIRRALHAMDRWYVGDGWFSDGPEFHADYYNSYVIHPMLLQILDVLVATGTRIGMRRQNARRDLQLRRMQRYGDQLERLISPEGTFPPIGRSLTYRTAAFQPLGLLAWRKQLPGTLGEGQVRGALAAVQRRIFADPSNFDAEGFLTLGFAGRQPGLADGYSNAGSMYVVSESFLPLGLSPEDSFWTVPAQPWTSKKAYANQAFPRDGAIGF